MQRLNAAGCVKRSLGALRPRFSAPQAPRAACSSVADVTQLQLCPGEVHVWWLAAKHVGLTCACACACMARDPRSPPREATAARNHVQAPPVRHGALQASDPALLQHYAKLLTTDELAAVKEASHEAVMRQRLLARALVRCTLSRYQGVGAPQQVRCR